MTAPMDLIGGYGSGSDSETEQEAASMKGAAPQPAVGRVVSVKGKARAYM